jgi:hypothetical protein
MIIGAKKTFKFFFQKRKAKGERPPNIASGVAPTRIPRLTLRWIPCCRCSLPATLSAESTAARLRPRREGRLLFPECRHRLFSGRDPAGALRLGDGWDLRGGIRIPQPLRRLLSDRSGDEADTRIRISILGLASAIPIRHRRCSCPGIG